MHYVVLKKQLRKGTQKNIFIPITEKKRLTPGKIKVKKTLFVFGKKGCSKYKQSKNTIFVFIQSWKQRNWLFSLFKDENQSVICPPVEAQMPETSTWVQERRICSILAHQACKTLVYVQITVGPCRRRRAQIYWSGDFLYTYTSGDFWGSRSEAADARRLLFISKMRISSQSEPKFHMFHFWFPTDDSNTSLMYRSDEEKKKGKKKQ